MPPPRAPQRPHRLEKHGDVRLDDYYWLRNREDPAVRAYLEAESAWLRESLAHTAAHEEQLFEEIKRRIRQTDMSVPYREGAYLYHRRYEDGREYPIHCRRALAAGGAPGGEEVILDVNAVAAGHAFCDVGSRRVSPDGRRLAYAVDTVGRRRYTVRFRDLTTGQDFQDVVPDVTANVAWAAGSDAVFYARQDPETLRPYQILRHRLGDDPGGDRIVYEECDPEFSCAVWRSRSQRYILIGSFQTVTTEIRYLDAADPEARPVAFLPRERGHEYEIDHYRGGFYIRTNAGARNFRLMETDEDRPERAHWRELLPHRDDVLLEGFALFRGHLVAAERRAGLTVLRVRPWSGPGEHEIAFDEPAYASGLGVNLEPDTTTLRFHYSSMVTPESVYDYDMTDRTRTLRKREEVLGGYDPSHYETLRLEATAADGVQVPISLVRRRSGTGEGSAAAAQPPPLLLYGYGSYGISMEASFSSPRLSLLDRGFAYAIAHIRGGEELGRRWYDDGKLLRKKNTFTDFIACAEQLVATEHAAPDRLFAMGGSAGGLLMGAVVNLRPDLFHGVVAQVPFVDVLTTMLDETIPLTTGEYDEWGNPNEPQAYEYIRSYSPYDNMQPVTWPHLLVMTGLHDSQVQYWEPAKWVARRRAMQPDDGRRLLLKTNMEAGHGGASGRYRRYRELALQYAFLLDLAGAGGSGPDAGA